MRHLYKILSSAKYGLLLPIMMLMHMPAHALELSQLTLHADIANDYQLKIYADIPNARALAIAAELKTVFVSDRRKKIYAIHNQQRYIVLDGLKAPHGLEWRSPYLYVGEQHRITRYHIRQSNIVNNGNLDAELIVNLPNYRHHAARSLRLSPDGGYLYVALGAPCNICRLEGVKGTIARIDLNAARDISQESLEIIAYGVRNSVGMAFRKNDTRLYFTDNGADNMGNDVPKEELNRVDKIGQHFGFPYYGGGNARTKFPLPDNPPEFTLPIAEIPAHNAPLGVHFYNSLTQYPNLIPKLQNKALIALHGSWNRSVPDGYRVVMIDFNQKPIKVEKLIDGFLHMKQGRGRPVDVATLWDGSLLISDDAQDKIYQLTAK